MPKGPGQLGWYFHQRGEGTFGAKNSKREGELLRKEMESGKCRGRGGKE